MQDSLNTYCKGCDQFSAPHRRRDDGQWVCEDCGHLVECSDPQWSDNCDGDLTTPYEVKKGLCEGCMAVIDSWSDDSEEASGSEQTKLMTDGGTVSADGEGTDDGLVDAGRLEKLSIAPDSDEPSATREKVLAWAVASGNGRIVVALSALDEPEDMYTAIAKGWLSKQEARDLRDSLDEVLEDE
jgi:hypothetical protein